MSWLFTFHLIGIVLWIGGMILLTRLLSAHTALTDNGAREALIPFERKSYWFGTFPGLLIVVGTGLSMLIMNGVGVYLNPKVGVWGPTFHIKLTIVFIMIVLDFLTAMKMKKLHKEGTGSKGFFMATHGTIALGFMFIIMMMETRIFA